MTLKKERIDITEHVKGHFKDGGMHLYHENEPIGRMTGMDQYELKSGYIFQDQKFYKMADTISKPDAKYVDCDDQQGWC
ncbi:YusG family protein [Bacillus sp. NSP9.1]|uniref:YusG family protein n=1 Tax=Bacillus sp. NSP9.1 TaxID=1071078 RepID=UPI0003FF2EE6|nr:YusG family protein [Bacillus sp. NSP9.1]QHZ45679.1 YusG family protein [Bacillus sp. NSP9.1]